LSAYPTLDAQIARLIKCGFTTGQKAIDINFAHDNWMGKSELKRIAALEMLDEMEEWRLLAAHYCLVWGWVSPKDSTIFNSWETTKDNKGSEFQK
jgi:[phosphatase 2A protein]-leucine-carboxy methyltransferase